MSTVTARVTLVGRDRALSAQPVWLENTRLLLVLLHALIVHPTLSLQMAASLKPHVNVRLDIREKMREHVRNAASTITKQAWGLRLALIVHQTPPLLLAAYQSQPVNATLVTLDKMEPHARNVVSTNTKKAWERRIALLVL